MPLGVLITQCLQHDFVGALGLDDPIPGPLHVGHREAQRLLGDDPGDGPLASFMRWAHAQPTDRLRIVHVRDWHDPEDPSQRAHLARFGPHCVRGTHGATFVGGIEEHARTRIGDGISIVDASGLCDFEGTSLAAELEAARRDAPDGRLRVGVIGVWTDAKVTFLLYDLHARARIDDLGTCSALTASASRAQHLVALDQLARLLDVRVEHSVSAFASWLVSDDAGVLSEARPLAPGALVDVSFRAEPTGPLAEPASADRTLLSWLFRDCRRVEATPLAGGFSGASVLLVDSVDALGHAQAPSVVKIGPRADIAHERLSMERVEDVLGNHAPRIVGFGDDHARGAIRFRYASMGRGKVTSFQRLYQSGADDPAIERVLRSALGDVLGRLYAAATPEPLDVLADYEFSSRWAASVGSRVTELAGDASGDTVTVPVLGVAPNVARFYERLDVLPRTPGARHPVAFVHGDLNGQNVIVDAGGNVWIIDFGRLRRAHALRDFAKLENDLLYVMTPLEPEHAREATVLVEALLDRELHRPLGPPPPNVRAAPLLRAWRTIGVLRSIARELVADVDPVGYRIGLLRFAAHTLSFDEPTLLQRRWALFACGRLARRIEHDLVRRDRLRIDWVSRGDVTIGATLCPGRADFGRDLARDLATLSDEGVTDLVSVVTRDELAQLGVPALVEAARAAGLEPRLVEVEDGAPPSSREGVALVRAIAERARAGRRVVVHCRAGLGRTGTVIAAALVELGASPAEAIDAVRASRGPRAIETDAQESWLRASG